MKILVVEDEPIIRLGLVSLIEDQGYEVVEAINADHAIRLLDADSNIHLVVTDVDMPGTMDGIKLAHHVRDRWPPVKLLVISGKAGIKPSQLPDGARFVSKPYQEPVLIGTIKALLESGAAL